MGYRSVASKYSGLKNCENDFSYGNIRLALELNRTLTNDCINTRDDRWIEDEHDTCQYFDLYPEWKQEVFTFFEEIHNQAEKIICVDICGRASGEVLGADKSYTFSLKTPPDCQTIKKINAHLQGMKEPDVIYFNGDIFNVNDFYNFVELLRKDNVQPSLITFFPVAGLHVYAEGFEEMPILKRVAYKLLQKRLIHTINILKPGGFLHIGCPFQERKDWLTTKAPLKEWRLYQQIEQIAKEMKCSFRTGTSFGSKGPAFLLRKTIIT